MPPQRKELSDSARGGLAAFGGFLAWGVVPLFWKQLENIDAAELVAHRVVWSLAVLLALRRFRRDGSGGLRAAFADPRQLGGTFLSGGLLTVNWFTYVWAVNHGFIIGASLGYFLVPLFNVAIGCLVLGERLRRLQWLAIAAAACGVALLLVAVGGVPWIALTLAGSWGLYSVMQKRSVLGSNDGLIVEAALYAPFALAYLAWRQYAGEAVLGHAGLRTHILILSTGWVTALPLILFVYGARRIRLSTLGLLQFLTPTVQFLIGLLVYHETFDAARLRGSLFIWCGLALYAADSLLAQRRMPRAAATG